MKRDRIGLWGLKVLWRRDCRYTVSEFRCLPVAQSHVGKNWNGLDIKAMGVRMRFKTTLRLIAGMFFFPLSSLYANGWYAPPPYPGVQFIPQAQYAVPPAPLSSRSLPGSAYAPPPVQPRWTENAGRYRFRPWQEGGNLQRPARMRYLPPVTIADHYRFRPLNPVKRRPPESWQAYRQPPTPPMPPAWGRPVYGGFAPAMPGTRWSGRPLYAGYAPGGPAWHGEAVARPVPRREIRRPIAPPRFTQQPYPGWRFRPLAPGPAVPPGRYVRFNPRERGTPPFPYGAPGPLWYAGRVPPMPAGWNYRAPVQTAYRPLRAPLRANRYGVDWYDGRGDGEGAWYRLAAEPWPAVSQRWREQPVAEAN